MTSPIELKQQGNTAFANEKTAEAVRLYTLSIDGLLALPDDSAERKEQLPLVYSNRAAANYALAEYEKCVNDATEALKLKPDHVKSILRRGQACCRLLRIDEAEADMKLLDSIRALSFGEAVSSELVEGAKQELKEAKYLVFQKQCAEEAAERRENPEKFRKEKGVPGITRASLANERGLMTKLMEAITIHRSTEQIDQIAEILGDSFSRFLARNTTDLNSSVAACAAQLGDIAMLDTLHKYGADYKTPDDNNATVLNVAAQKGHAACVEHLITTYHIDPNLRTYDLCLSPLDVAAQANQAEVIAALARCGADPNDSKGQCGARPIHGAAMRGCREAIDALVAAGADPKAKDGMGRDIVDYAGHFRHGNLKKRLKSKYFSGPPPKPAEPTKCEYLDD